MKCFQFIMAILVPLLVKQGDPIYERNCEGRNVWADAF